MSLEQITVEETRLLKKFLGLIKSDSFKSRLLKDNRKKIFSGLSTRSENYQVFRKTFEEKKVDSNVFLSELDRPSKEYYDCSEDLYSSFLEWYKREIKKTYGSDSIFCLENDSEVILLKKLNKKSLAVTVYSIPCSNSGCEGILFHGNSTLTVSNKGECSFEVYPEFKGYFCNSGFSKKETHENVSILLKGYLSQIINK